MWSVSQLIVSFINNHAKLLVSYLQGEKGDRTSLLDLYETPLYDGASTNSKVSTIIPRSLL